MLRKLIRSIRLKKGYGRPFPKQVSTSLLQTYISTESIKDWYEKLKEHPGISEYEAEPKHEEDIKGRQIDQQAERHSWLDNDMETSNGCSPRTLGKHLSAATNPIDMMVWQPI